MESREEAARRLLDSVSESLELDPAKLARVAGQFITPEGNQVYRVRLGGRTVYVTVPEDGPPVALAESALRWNARPSKSDVRTVSHDNLHPT